MIKIADKIANLSDILQSPPADWSDERRLQYVEWSRTVVDGCRGQNAALEAKYDETVARFEVE